MDILEYQRSAMRTRGKYRDRLDQATCAGMGLAGETGEFVEIIKKVVWHEKKMDFETLSKIQKELGDILWYVALAADALNMHLDEVAHENIRKLKLRYPIEFSGHLAQQKLDEQETFLGEPSSSEKKVKE